MFRTALKINYYLKRTIFNLSSFEIFTFEFKSPPSPLICLSITSVVRPKNQPKQNKEAAFSYIVDSLQCSKIKELITIFHSTI